MGEVLEMSLEKKCEKCKFVWRDDRSPDMCSNEKMKEEHQDPTRVLIVVGKSETTGRLGIPYCQDYNPNNDCKYYQKKGWMRFLGVYD